MVGVIFFNGKINSQAEMSKGDAGKALSFQLSSTSPAGRAILVKAQEIPSLE
jgi:hypothetical protein